MPSVSSRRPAQKANRVTSRRSPPAMYGSRTRRAPSTCFDAPGHPRDARAPTSKDERVGARDELGDEPSRQPRATVATTPRHETTQTLPVRVRVTFRGFGTGPQGNQVASSPPKSAGRLGDRAPQQRRHGSPKPRVTRTRRVDVRRSTRNTTRLQPGACPTLVATRGIRRRPAPANARVECEGRSAVALAATVKPPKR